MAAELTVKQCHDSESQKKTFEYDDQNATKITSAVADTSIRFFRPVTSTSVQTLSAYLFLVIIFLTVCHRPFSPSVATMSSSNSADVWTERWIKGADLCGEDFFYDAVVLCQRHINLVFDEDKMEPARLEEAPKTLGMSQWKREPVCEGNNPHLLSLSRVSQVVTGTNRPSYKIRRPTENDEARLTKKKGEMPPPLPGRIDNPRIREDPALLEYYSISDKIHRATSLRIFLRKHGSTTVNLFSAVGEENRCKR